MIDILIVEDDVNKARVLLDFVEKELSSRQPRLTVARSYQSGLSAALDGSYGLVLLDMTLPTWDVTPQEPGGRVRPFAGREILYELEREERATRVIVVTQFESFGEGTRRQTLDELSRELSEDFPTLFCGSVFYQPSNTNWQTKLRRALENAIGE